FDRQDEVLVASIGCQIAGRLAAWGQQTIDDFPMRTGDTGLWRPDLPGLGRLNRTGSAAALRRGGHMPSRQRSAVEEDLPTLPALLSDPRQRPAEQRRRRQQDREHAYRRLFDHHRRRLSHHECEGCDETISPGCDGRRTRLLSSLW